MGRFPNVLGSKHILMDGPFPSRGQLPQRFTPGGTPGRGAWTTSHPIKRDPVSLFCRQALGSSAAFSSVCADRGASRLQEMVPAPSAGALTTFTLTSATWTAVWS